MSYLKGEFNLVQTIKTLAIIGGGILISYGILKTAHYAERIYVLLLNKF